MDTGSSDGGVVAYTDVVQATTTAAGRRTTTATTTTTTTVDPCLRVTCRHGARCVMEDGAARCRCPPSRCSTHVAAPVCGTDHTDYTSHCEMRAASCRQQRHIGKLYDGHCGNYSRPTAVHSQPPLSSVFYRPICAYDIILP